MILKKKQINFIIIFLLFQFIAEANDTIYIFKNAKIYASPSHVLDNAYIAIKDKNIISINADYSNLPKYSEPIKIIDCKGKHIYPGLIAPVSILGLNEIDAVRSTKDFYETGINNASTRTQIAFNSDSKILPTVIQNGVLSAHIVPSGDLITGISSVLNLDGSSWQNATLSANTGLVINWPESVVKTGWWAEPGETRKKQNNEYYEYLNYVFTQALAYSKQQNPLQIDLKMEAISQCFKNPNFKIFVNCNYADDIKLAIHFFEKFGLNIVIVGGKESFKITKLLVEKTIPIILIKTHNLPENDLDDVNFPYQLPKILSDSNVLFCIGEENTYQQRNLPFQIGTAIAHGLNKDSALASATINAAKILGIEHKIGKLEVGYLANFVISEGSLFDITSNQISMIYINGKKQDFTKNIQNQLYERYKKQD